jgi:hypothetical protein
MLRVTLAAVAVTALLASSSLAGDCGCGMGMGRGYSSRGFAANAWDGYCDGGIGCNSCGGCQRCCFPLIHNTLDRVGRVFDALLPDPCCRRTCGRALGCAQPTCGIEPGCGAVGMPADPFMDDHVAPTPTPSADARGRSLSKARMTTFPQPAAKPALKPTPMKSTSRSKVASKVPSKSGKSVLKVAYDEESVEDSEDAPPAAPASVRQVVEAKPEPARFAAKPVVHVKNAEPANPLRP